MAELLTEIISRKREEVAVRLNGRPVPAEPTGRSLREAIAQAGARFIMEVKQSSPSGHRAGWSLEEAVAAYAPVTDALSVLTDGPDFGGSLDDLRRARRLFDGPILAKDFIVDPAQVSEARATGADAVLAMMSVLDDPTAADVLSEAKRLGMDAVVEVHDEFELRRAMALQAKIIGINNRDLRTLEVNLAVTERLAPLVPPGILVIAESGIGSRADVSRLAHHADAFLVGSSLMASTHIAQAARALVHGRVKICGLTSGNDVVGAAEVGATHAGFIFVPGTPRALAPLEAEPLVKLTRRAGMMSVGVFRNADASMVARTAERLGLDAVQLHGNEDAFHFRKRIPKHAEIWALCGVGASAAPARAGADRSLFDTLAHGRSGGTGIPFDWSAIDGREDLCSAFLAGGIGPSNAADASRVGTYGIDVGSSVELRPGVKDPAKLAELFAALRPAARPSE